MFRIVGKLFLEKKKIVIKNTKTFVAIGSINGCTCAGAFKVVENYSVWILINTCRRTRKYGQ